MLDLALATLEPPLPPEVPRIVEERQWLSSLASQAERRTRVLADQYQATVDEWLKKLRQAHDGWRAVTPDLVAGTVPADLNDLVERTELFADHRARRRSSFAKQGRRRIGQLFASDPSVASVYRAFHNRLLAIDDEVIQALLDHALFLRAVRADLDPEARGGPSFSDPASLGRHLRSLVAP